MKATPMYPFNFLITFFSMNVPSFYPFTFFILLVSIECKLYDILLRKSPFSTVFLQKRGVVYLWVPSVCKS